MPSKVNLPTVRAAIYARYSSDNQREASIEDQIEVCRRYAEVQGWEIVEVYPDRALSGASRFRPVQKIGVRLPLDVHEWISARAERNMSSINAEIIRAIRNGMDRQVPCTTPSPDRPGAAS